MRQLINLVFLLMLVLAARPQEQTVSGTVADGKNGQPFSGVTVLKKNGNSHALSNTRVSKDCKCRC